MELLVIVAVTFVVGYAVGKARSRRPRHSVAPTDPARPGTVPRRGTSSRRYSGREREYGGLGALGATNDPGDFGDAGP